MTGNKLRVTMVFTPNRTLVNVYCNRPRDVDIVTVSTVMTQGLQQYTPCKIGQSQIVDETKAAPTIREMVEQVAPAMPMPYYLREQARLPLALTCRDYECGEESKDVWIEYYSPSGRTVTGYGDITVGYRCIKCYGVIREFVI